MKSTVWQRLDTLLRNTTPVLVTLCMVVAGVVPIRLPEVRFIVPMLALMFSVVVIWGAAVIGVSKDSVRRHDNFKAKHDLNFPLASDESGEICEAYGVWVEKKNYGRTYMGIERTTFLIDGKGIIRDVWRKVRVKGHVDKVMDALGTL